MAKNSILGLRGLDKALRALEPKLARQQLGNAVAAGARVVRDEAKARVPIETGLLKESIVVRRPRGTLGQAVVGFLSPVSRRAHLTEFGTSRSRAKPFMRPALDTKADAAIRKIADTLRRGLDRLARSVRR